MLTPRCLEISPFDTPKAAPRRALLVTERNASPCRVFRVPLATHFAQCAGRLRQEVASIIRSHALARRSLEASDQVASLQLEDYRLSRMERCLDEAIQYRAQMQM
jgi:hypothetical protein